MTRLALIDGDIIVYKIAAISEEKCHFGPGTSVDEKKAERELNGYINDLADLVRADEVLVCLSDDARNWREEYWKGYKRNRDPQRRPVLWGHVRQFLEQEWPTKMVTALEADDVMGITATAPGFRPDCEKVIISEDKDLHTVPGLHFNPAKDSKVRRVSPLEADRRFLYQTLIGDPVDGYPGAPRIGPKSVYASRILSAPDLLSAWNACVDGYKAREPKEAGDEARDLWASMKALFQSRLARILRHGDYSYQGRHPILWAPQDPDRPWISRREVGIAPLIPE